LTKFVNILYGVYWDQYQGFKRPAFWLNEFFQKTAPRYCRRGTDLQSMEVATTAHDRRKWVFRSKHVFLSHEIHYFHIHITYNEDSKNLMR
jgi:hypothetical protein